MLLRIHFHLLILPLLPLLFLGSCKDGDTLKWAKITVVGETTSERTERFTEQIFRASGAGAQVVFTEFEFEILPVDTSAFAKRIRDIARHEHITLCIPIRCEGKTQHIITGDHRSDRIPIIAARYSHKFRHEGNIFGLQTATLPAFR